MKRLSGNYYWLTWSIVILFIFPTGCSKDKNGDRLLFSIEDDVNLGIQVSGEVDSTYRAKGQLIERKNPQYAAAYQHLDQVINKILDSGKVAHRSEFKWETKIIKDDNVLNAFATPGGYIYVFTGLIKYLDNEDQLAGVLGHEIAHADKRHTTKQLQTQYGIALLLSVALGDNPGTLTKIATGLASLKFGRDAEREADDFSVIYLGATSFYACNGAAGFFQKMLSQENAGVRAPEFLSTHPDPGNRVEAINTKAQSENCTTTLASETNYQNFKNSLN